MIKVLRNKTPIARKEHRCEFCGEVIHIGEYAKGYKHGFDDGIKECLDIIKKNGNNRTNSDN